LRAKPTNPKPTGGPSWLLRRADQAGVACLVLLGLAGTAGWWLAQGGWQGRLVEFDRTESREAAFLVDINQAAWPELAQLPGIGETLARRIVDSRQNDGPFVDHQDLTRVRGIGPKTLDNVRPYLLPMPDSRGVAGQGHGNAGS
jgi:competence protein ComEA